MDAVEFLRASLGMRDVQELSGGHQSCVFSARRQDGSTVAVKSIDASSVSRGHLETRLGAVEALADLDRRVCRPVALANDQLVIAVDTEGRPHYIVAFEFAFGVAPEPDRRSDASGMGAALAGLHQSMRQLPPVALPAVRALAEARPGGTIAGLGAQLLHGDFSAGNIRRTDDDIRIFDFEDCGYGPPEFDVANALYMVLFDQTTRGTPEVYETFRRSFLDGYLDAADPSFRADTLDGFIDLRVGALAIWLDDLDDAPIGIRDAPPSWQATLHSFVASYRSATA